MRVEIDPPVTHVAPLSRSMLSTAELGIVGLVTGREPEVGSVTSSPSAPVSVHGATARRTLPQRSHEWRSLDSAFAGVSTTGLGSGHPSGVVGQSLGDFSQQAAIHPTAHALERRSSMLVQGDWRPLTPPEPIPVSATTLDAPSLDPAEPAVPEDLWARPTSDIADLVAQVLAQLSEVRRNG